MGKVVAVVLVVLARVGGAAAAEPPGGWPPWTGTFPRVLVSVGGRVGMNTSGMVALVEPGLGVRLRDRLTWHLDGAWSLGVARMGGGSNDVETSVAEIRTGPTWWACGGTTCHGLALEIGLQRLHRRETGGDGPEPLDRTSDEYLIMSEARFRARVPQGRGVALELSAGLQLGFTAHTDGYTSFDDSAYGGLLFGLALVGAL